MVMIGEGNVMVIWGVGCMGGGGNETAGWARFGLTCLLPYKRLYIVLENILDFFLWELAMMLEGGGSARKNAVVGEAG